MSDILATGLFTQKDADELIRFLALGPKSDPQVQFMVSGLRVRFHTQLTSSDDRKAFVHLLARFAKAFHFLSCFFSYARRSSDLRPSPTMSVLNLSSRAVFPT